MRCAGARVRELTLAVWLVLAFAASSAAQSAPPVGVLVEARIVRSDSVLGQLCTAWLGAVAGDTLVLNRSASCARGGHVARVRVHTDDRGSRLKHAGVGLLAGALLPAGRRWVDLPGELQIRVGAFDLRPAIRVALDERRR